MAINLINYKLTKIILVETIREVNPLPAKDHLLFIEQEEAIRVRKK